jgi:hypothetical protein
MNVGAIVYIPFLRFKLALMIAIAASAIATTVIQVPFANRPMSLFPFYEMKKPMPNCLSTGLW